MKKLFFTLFLALVPMSEARPIFASEPFEFASAVISSLELSKIARERLRESDNADFISLMRNVRVFGNEMLGASSIMGKFAGSRNELIKKSSRSFSLIYLSLAANAEEILQFVEDTLNKPGEAASKPGTWMRKLGESMAEQDEIWRTALTATVLATYTLVDRERMEGGKLRFLTITQAEQELLRSKLRRIFGDKISEGAKGGQFAIDAAGGLLWKFLSQPWQPATEN